MCLKKLYFLIVVIIFNNLTINAQGKDKTLFEVQGNPVKMSEFKKVYEKNLALITDPVQRDIDNYLDLYINYKLKLREAYDLQMDTIPSFIREYTKYKNQLLDPYMKDKNLELDLIQEAYDRMQYEINASHILLKIDKNITPKDTLSLYNKLLDVRNRAMNGESFDSLAKEFSQDPSASRNGGNLGYFSVFQMVYPFENVVYNTTAGEVSMPFRTRFGYHIVKVHDKRPNRGEVEVAHIMLKGDFEKNAPLISNIKKQLDEGADFAQMAKDYSQDTGTATKGGVLPRFGSGRMIPEFEKVAFSLENEEAISDPFKTGFGWHIIKLLRKYPVGSYDEVEEVIKAKVEQGQRAQMMGNSVVNRLYKTYKYQVSNELLDAFNKEQWMDDQQLQSQAVFYTVNKENFPVLDFYNFYKARRNKSVTTVLNEYKEAKTIEVYKLNLPKEYPALSETLNEYKEGILLFNLMQDKIWDRAEKDTLGLQAFFDKNQSQYQWNDRLRLSVVNMQDDAIESVLEFLSSQDTEHPKNVIEIHEELLETNDKNIPEGLSHKQNSHFLQKIGNQYRLYYVKEFLPASTKTLPEVKGKVMSAYQDHLEKEWMTQLRERYPVEVNSKTLKKFKKMYK
jgi:peptidyl-prolyl cis-trans isomerase SurA